MVNHVVITSNLDMYSFTKELKKLNFDEFCLLFSSIKAVSLLGRGVAEQLVQNRTEASSLLHY